MEKFIVGEYVLGRALEARRMVSDVMTVNQQQQALNELCKKESAVCMYVCTKGPKTYLAVLL